MSWKEECDAIHKEMDRLLAAGWLETAEERQVRKIQFMALIERRNVAAQNFLKADGDKAESNQQKPSETPPVMTNADPRFEVAAMNVKISQEPSEAGNVVDRSSQVPPDDPMFEFDIMNVKVSQESFEAPLAAECDPQAPPADPVSEVETMNVKISQEPPEAFTIERSPQALPADPVSEVETMNVKTSQEPSEAAPTIDQSPQAPPADPRFEARNFLKLLGLR
jgi:hypothetical protein